MTNNGFRGGGSWLFLSTNSSCLTNWKYQESQGAQICVPRAQEQNLCFCLFIRQRKSQILTWCMLTQALKSVNLSGDLWFIQCHPVMTIGKHRWLSLLLGAMIPKLIEELSGKAGS